MNWKQILYFNLLTILLFGNIVQSLELRQVTISDASTEQTQKLRIINGCDQGPMRIVYQAPVPAGFWTQNIRLDFNQAADYYIPINGIPATRFWPKFDCDAKGENCSIGESGGPGLPCPPNGCSPPIDSKFEATFQGPNQDDWFDTSQVDGWTLPYKFYFKCTSTFEKTIDCSQLSANKCPTQYVDGAGTVNLEAKTPWNGKYSGCYSPCGLLTYSNWNNPFGKYSPNQSPADKYCCAGQYATADKCNSGPVTDMEFTKAVHTYCPGVYAWAYDDGTGLYNCPSNQTKFTITFFCPS